MSEHSLRADGARLMLAVVLIVGAWIWTFSNRETTYLAGGTWKCAPSWATEVSHQEPQVVDGDIDAFDPKYPSLERAVRSECVATAHDHFPLSAILVVGAFGVGFSPARRLSRESDQ